MIVRGKTTLALQVGDNKEEITSFTLGRQVIGKSCNKGDYLIQHNNQILILTKEQFKDNFEEVNLPLEYTEYTEYREESNV